MVEKARKRNLLNRLITMSYWLSGKLPCVSQPNSSLSANQVSNLTPTSSSKKIGHGVTEKINNLITIAS